MEALKMFENNQIRLNFFYFLIRLYQNHRIHFEERKKQSTIWPELDTNLLGEIMGKLCLTDQARFRAVCKNWLAVRPINSTTKSLPWYVKFDRSVAADSNVLEFRLYDTSSSYLCLVHKLSLTELGVPSPSCWSHIAASRKMNWLFIGISIPSLQSVTRRYFLLYSPFDKDLVKLPELDYDSQFKFRRTMSGDPHSPDCVFFLSETYNPDKIVIITYRKCDIKWIAREFTRHGSFIPCDAFPIYFRGMLCLVSPLGQLASYNIVNDKFKFENLLVDECFALNYKSSRVYQVFELNGELMLVYFGSKKKNVDTFLGKQCIKRYDWSNKVWVPVSTLGDNTLFVSDHILSVATINTESTRNTGVLSNKIYRFFEGGCIIYSLEDGDLVECKPINSNLLDNGGVDSSQNNYNCGITFWDATKAVYWLEPPALMK